MDKNKVNQGLTNNFDITYTAQFDLLGLPSSETSWTWKGKVEDNSKNKYQPVDVITVVVCSIDPDCDDSDACTTDVCSGGSCSNTPINCDDGSACTADTCDPATGCGYAPITCDDLDVCTDDSCNPATGCVFTDNVAACDDGDACTHTDTCSAGVCAGTAYTCDDSNVCTDDSCNGDGSCTFTNNAAACDDGQFCTQTDTCSSGVCTSVGDTCSPLLCDEVLDVCIPATRVANIDSLVETPFSPDSPPLAIAPGPFFDAILGSYERVNIELFYSGRFSDAADPSFDFLAPGSTSTPDNVTVYLHGITGIRVYFDGIVTFTTTPAAAFTFEWTSGTGVTFSPVTDAATAITVTQAEQAGATVVTVVLDDDHVRIRWLKIAIDAGQVFTSGGESSWERVETTLVAGTITVSRKACRKHRDCNDRDRCTDDTCVAGVCEYVRNERPCRESGEAKKRTLKKR